MKNIYVILSLVCFAVASVSCTSDYKDPLYDEFVTHVKETGSANDIVGVWVSMNKKGGVQSATYWTFYKDGTGKSDSKAFGNVSVTRGSFDLDWRYLGAGKWSFTYRDPKLKSSFSDVEMYLSKGMLLWKFSSKVPFFTPFTYLKSTGYGVCERKN